MLIAIYYSCSGIWSQKASSCLPTTDVYTLCTKQVTLEICKSTSMWNFPYKPSPQASCTDCCIVLCWSYPVGGGVRGWSACCAASRTDCTDAGPDLCTLCLDCTLHPDLCTLCLWCLFSFNLCNHSTCTGDGCYQLQLALVVVFIQPLAQILYVHSGNLLCVVVVVNVEVEVYMQLALFGGLLCYGALLTVFWQKRSVLKGV